MMMLYSVNLLGRSKLHVVFSLLCYRLTPGRIVLICHFKTYVVYVIAFTNIQKKLHVKNQIDTRKQDK